MKEMIQLWRGAAFGIALSLLLSANVSAQSIEPFAKIEGCNHLSFNTVVVTGDYDNDGDLDMAVGGGTFGSIIGNGSPMLVILRNDGIVPGTQNIQCTQVWQTAEPLESVEDLAWGDYDNDGWLDLATGGLIENVLLDALSGTNSRIYRNQMGDGANATQLFKLVWTSPDIAITSSVAWADIDNDKDLDLAVGNDDSPSHIYRNNGLLADKLTLSFSSVWTSPAGQHTSDIAWGDVNQDSYVDLAIGNGSPAEGQPTHLYLNHQGNLSLQPDWTSATSYTTNGLAFGDSDGDGDLDLVTANGAMVEANNEVGQPNLIFRNDHGMLTTTPVWQSEELDMSMDVAWGDLNGDGKDDLIFANRSSISSDDVSRVYMNHGVIDQRPIFTATWSFGSEETANAVAIADINNDGSLDFAIANGANLGEFVRLYLNQSALMSSTPPWIPPTQMVVWDMAWGDVDSDGDLDLAIGCTCVESTGVFAEARLYRFQNGKIDTEPIWHSKQFNVSESGMRSVVWGDSDGDGDLDLAIGLQSASAQLYENKKGTLSAAPIWESAEQNETIDLAWGDMDGDGDLDLALTNGGVRRVDKTLEIQPNRIYRNENGKLSQKSVWEGEPQNSPSNSVAWGDVDNDGDLDLVFGNLRGTPTFLYRNDGQDSAGKMRFNKIWSSSEKDDTTAISWGDYDGDGDLDLAVGNALQPNRIYQNNQGTLSAQPSWSSGQIAHTTSLVWVDYDGDGDLDLATAEHAGTSGNTSGQGGIQIYRNDLGTLTALPAWSVQTKPGILSLSTVDIDMDGDYDIIGGHYADSTPPLSIYKNTRRSPLSGNNPPQLSLSHPGKSDSAFFFAHAEINQSATLIIPYTLLDAESDIVPFIIPQFSTNGGGSWHPATSAAGGDGTVSLSTSAQGTAHTFVWNVAADLIRSDTVLFRIQAQPKSRQSPILWPAVDAKSTPFRLATPWYIKVVDEFGNAKAGAIVFAEGQPITQTRGGLTVTDQAGLLAPTIPLSGMPLVAMSQVSETTTARPAHHGWAYRTYLTSLDWNNSDSPSPLFATAKGEQHLVLKSTQPLILFNLVASIEWGHDEKYLNQLTQAFRSGQSYLYDLSDGQMALGQVTLYENREHWTDADIQISAQTGQRPYSSIGGIVSSDLGQVIHLGRQWEESTWDKPKGYRTIIHEFGHYGLHLRDEYLESGSEESCIQDNPTENQASAMNWYTSTELSALNVTDLWADSCKAMPQFKETQKSSWETVQELYQDSTLWRLITPMDRGKVNKGPTSLLRGLPDWPIIETIDNGLPVAKSRLLSVLNANGEPFRGFAVVTLYQEIDTGIRAIDQGWLDKSGQLSILGASPGDIVRVSVPTLGLFGEVNVTNALPLTIQLKPSTQVQGASSGKTPVVDLVPQTIGDIAILNIFVRELVEGQFISATATLPGRQIPNAINFEFNAGIQSYVGQLLLEPNQSGNGQITLSYNDNGAIYFLHSSYLLRRLAIDKTEDLFSTDGNLRLTVPLDTLAVENTIAVIATNSTPPRLLPPALEFAGEVHDISLSGAQDALEKAIPLVLYYDPTILTNDLAKSLTIYYFQLNGSNQQGEWVKLPSIINEARHSVAASISHTGTYVLLRQTTENPLSQEIYLPIVTR